MRRGDPATGRSLRSMVQMWWHRSLRRPLTLLVVIEVMTTSALLAVVLLAFRSFDHHVAFLRRFTVSPVTDIEHALGVMSSVGKSVLLSSDASETLLRIQPDLDVLQSFVDRYQSHWLVAGSEVPDAILLQKALVGQGRGELLDQERDAVRELRESLTTVQARLVSKSHPFSSQALITEVTMMDQQLRALLNINVHQIEAAHKQVQDTTRRQMVWIAILGMGALLGATTLGLAVRRAIAPRIKRMLASVRRFQGEGIYVPIRDSGKDDLTLLAHALDAGFGSIVAHEKARERFLSVVAHELKTPVTSIQGFAEVAAMEESSGAARSRALDIVYRNARRLGHLVEDVLLAARARNRDLPFRPRPTDLVALTRRVVKEVQASAPSHPFIFEPREPYVNLLADKKLLEHALWSLMSSAAKVSLDKAPVEVMVYERDAVARVELRLTELLFAPMELEGLFTPFGTVSYEDREIRGSVGLFLCREVARLHGGTVRLGVDEESPAKLTLELPS